VIGHESGGNRVAVSPKGARGLGQLMPATAARFGVKDVNDPEQNIRGATDYLKFLTDRYKGDTDKVLAGYNAGEGNVDKYGGIPPFKETQNYVPAVKARYVKLTGQQPQSTSQDPYFTPDTKGQKAAQPATTADSYFTPDAQPAQALSTGKGAVRPVSAPVRRFGGGQVKPMAPRSLTTNDAAWHFGMTPDEARTMSPKAAQVLQAAVADDARKKAAGQAITAPPLAYQNQMRAQAGLKPLQYNMPTQTDARAPYFKPEVGSLNIDRPIVVREPRSGFTTNPQNDDQMRLAIRAQVAKEMRPDDQRLLDSGEGRSAEIDAETNRRLAEIKSTQAREASQIQTGPSAQAAPDSTVSDRLKQILGTTVPAIGLTQGLNLNQRDQQRLNDIIDKYAPGVAALDTPEGIKTDLPRGLIHGATLGAVGRPKPTDSKEEVLPGMTRFGFGETAGSLVPLAATEGLLPEGLAPAVRTAATFGVTGAGRQAVNAAEGRPVDLKAPLVDAALGLVMGRLSGADPSMLRRAAAYVAPGLALDIAQGSSKEDAAHRALVNLGFAVSGGGKESPAESEADPRPASIAPVIADARAERVADATQGAQPLETIDPKLARTALGTALAQRGGNEVNDTGSRSDVLAEPDAVGSIRTSSNTRATPEASVVDSPGSANPIIRHSDPRIDGGEVIGRTGDGKLKVQNNEGGVSVVQDPRRQGNREAAIVRSPPIEQASEPAPAEPASQPALVTPEGGGSSPSTPEIVKPWEMTRSQIEDEYQRKKAEDDNLEESILGPELAKRYARLQRSANSSYDTEKANRASDEIEKIEASLSERDRNRLYGIGEEGPQVDELKDYRQSLGNLDDHDPRSLAESMRWAVSRVGRETDPAKMTHEQRVAYGTLREAARIAYENGWDTQAISREAVKAAAGRFADPEDAAFMLDRFIKKDPQTTTPQRKQIAQVASPLVSEEAKEPIVRVAEDRDLSKYPLTPYEKIAAEITATLPAPKEGYTRLYRGKGTGRLSGLSKPRTGYPGQWFDVNPKGAALYGVTREGEIKSLSYVDIPTTEISKYHALDIELPVEELNRGVTPGEYVLPKEIASQSKEIKLKGVDPEIVRDQTLNQGYISPTQEEAKSPQPKEVVPLDRAEPQIVQPESGASEPYFTPERNIDGRNINASANANGATEGTTDNSLASTTSARKAQVDAERESRGAEPLPWSPKTKSDAELLDSAKQANDSNPDQPRRIVQEVLTKPRALSDKETVQLDLHKQQLKNEHAALLNEIAKTSDPEKLATQRAQLDSIERDFDAVDRAWRASGTEKGRGLRSQQTTINQDYDLVSMVTRYKAAVGKEPSPEIRTQIEGYQKRIAELEANATKATSKRALDAIQREVRAQGRARTRTVLDAEAATLKQGMAAEFARLKTERSKGQYTSLGGLGSLDPEGVITKLALKYARNRFEAGVNTVEGLTDEVHSALKDFVDVSKRDVAAMISGYGRQGVDKRSELTKQLSALKTDMRRELAAADGPKQGPRKPSPAGPRETKQIIHRRYDKQMAEVVQQIAALDAGTYQPKQPRGATVLDRETEASKVAVERAKQDFQIKLRKWQDEQRSSFDKGRDLLTKVRRSVVLSSTQVLGKLTRAAVERMAVSPGEEMIGAALNRVPGINRITRQAPVEHGSSLTNTIRIEAKVAASEIRALMDITNPNGEIRQVLRTGRSSSDVKQGEKNYGEASLLGLSGRIHAALKTVPRLGGEVRGMEKYLESVKRDDPTADLHDPRTIALAEGAGYLAGKRQILMQDNSAADWVKESVASLNRKGVPGKVAATATDIAMPIKRVPLNYVTESLNYALPGARAGLGIARALKQGNLMSLEPAEADAITRSLKKAGPGAAMLLWGYFSPQTFGGYYHPGKRDERDPQFGGMKLFGRNIPRFLSHSPLLEAAQIGATIRQTIDGLQESGASKGKLSNATAGIGQAAKGLGEEVPFLEDPYRALRAIHGEGGGLARYGGALASSITTPPDVKRLAGITDPAKPTTTGQKLWQFSGLTPTTAMPRKPAGFADEMRMGIPGLRQQVTANIAKQRTDEVDRLTSAARRGQNITADVDAAVKANILKPGDAKTIESAAKLTPTQSRFKSKGLLDAITAYENYDASRRSQVKDILADKATGVETLRLDDQGAARDRLRKLGFTPGIQIPKAPERPKRPQANPRAWATP
jgi:hypothetical protein